MTAEIVLRLAVLTPWLIVLCVGDVRTRRLPNALTFGGLLGAFALAAGLGGLSALADALAFQIRGLTFSPVKGPEGNIEFLAHLSLHGEPGIRPDTARVVEQAHSALDKGESL